MATRTMKVTVVERRFLGTKLKLKDVEIPQIMDDQVLIGVVAVGVNENDLKYKMFKGFNDIPGLECSGNIEAIGAKVQGWKIGDRVCAILDGGGYAEKVAVSSTQIFPVPKHIHLLDAASLPYAACITWLALFNHQQNIEIRPPTQQSILIYDGASALGVMAIQIAKHKGMKVLATAGTDENMQFCRNIGADICINHTKINTELAVKRATDGKGVDFLLDNVTFRIRIDLECCATRGKVFIAGSNETKAHDVYLATLLFKGLQIKVLDLENKNIDYKRSLIEKMKLELWPAIEEDIFKPAFYHWMPLEDAARAHKLMKNKENTKKILLFTRLLLA